MNAPLSQSIVSKSFSTFALRCHSFLYVPTHFYTTTSDHYSTHDWIAECALDLLVTKYPEHKFIQMMHLNIRDMKIYFLLGTEVPDSLRISGEKKFASIDDFIKKLPKKFDTFNRVKIRRILSSLEDKNLISVQKSGRYQEILVSDHLIKLEKIIY